VASRNTGVLIVGVGGLGVPAAYALSREGVRHLALVDPDPIELSNLARQIIFRTDDAGAPKVDAAARELKDAFGALDLESHRLALDSSNAAQLVRRYDFVIDATDNPAAKFLINDACIATRVPFVYGGVIGFAGQAMTVLPRETPCLRCLFEQPPDEAEIAGCREAGIVGPVAGAIGEIQAMEAIAWLRGTRPELAGAMLSYDGTTGRIRKTIVSARRGCTCAAWRAETDARNQASRHAREPRMGK
jgi:molybdopterin-synthase adenylyltransferase